MRVSVVERQRLAGANRRRLQTLYLVAATGLAALIPLILLASFWIRSELGKSQADIERSLRSQAAALSQLVDGEIEQQTAALRAISALPGLDDGASGFVELAARITAALPHWSSLTLANASDGSVAYSTPASAVRPDPSLVRRTGADRQPAVTTWSGNGTPDTVGVYMPVLRNGEVRHVILLTFDAIDIQELISRQTWNARLVASVVDGRGLILARSLSPGTAVGQQATTEFMEATQGRDSGLFQANSREGEPVTAAFVRSRLTGWVSSTQVSRRESDGFLSRSRWATIAAGALSLLVAGILAVFITHTLSERRATEERLSASRALGELDARLLSTSQEALTEQRKSASEREVLLREIYHRVKNNLQIVQSLLRLGSRDLKPDQREPFESAVRRIGAMSRVHTLLYNSPDLASIDFRDYLDELLRELSEGFSAEERAIESVLEAQAMRMPLDTAVPLAFIAVEILTNSFKHAFPDGRSGRITVDVRRTDGDAVLSISDDGVGIPHHDGVKRRLGLTIVRKLVQQIGGTLEEPPPGASVFVVRFPLVQPGAAAQPLPANVS